ncbi:Hypothetical predicted protein [Cloeon dipterum]|uniref:Ion transport domain-containing protein n=1 Tax=Cloeon dipterum TaxID=197152 RepID=A0A8S1D5Q1_9INSE|nr:Hypothetical predicted protein [Cloeon dipterum]
MDISDISDYDDSRKSNDRKRPIEEFCPESEDELVEKIQRMECDSSSAILDDIPALLYAAEYADAQVCRKLVDDGADVNETDKHGNNVYHFAALNRNNCDMELLDFFATRGAEMKRLNNDDADAVTFALINRNFKFARKLFNMQRTKESFLLRCIGTTPESIKFAYYQDPSVVKVNGSEEFDLRILREMAWFHDFETFKWIIEVATGSFGVDLSQNKELQLRILREAARNLDEPNGKAIAHFLFSLLAENWTVQDLTPVLIEVLPSGNLEVIQLMVNHGADLNVGMMKGHLSLFQYCVGMNAIDSALFLHQRNPEEISLSTLVAAATTENIQMCDLLIGFIKESKFDSLIRDFLHFAAKYTPFGAAIIRHFAPRMRVHINSVDIEGKTALHSAADEHNLASFQALLDIGADLTVNYHDVNLLHYCLFKNFVEGAKIVFAKDPSQLQGRQALLKYTFYHHFYFACAAGCCGTGFQLKLVTQTYIFEMDNKVEKSVPLIIKSAEKKQRAKRKEMYGKFFKIKLDFVEKNRGDLSRLHFAASLLDLDVCRHLVEHGADVRAKCSVSGANPLHYAAMNTTHGKELIRYFTSKGCSIKETDSSYMIPLEYALRERNFELATVLHQIMEEETNSGDTLLHFCVRTNNLNSAKFVFANNVDLTEEESYESGLLEYAVIYGDLAMCRWLLEDIGLNVDDYEPEDWKDSLLADAVTNDAHHKDIIPYLFARFNMNPNYEYPYFGSILVYALNCLKFSAAEQLMKQGADLKVRVDGMNILRHFVSKDLLLAAKFIHERDPEQLTEVAENGETILHFAAKFASLKMCVWLVELGCNIHGLNRASHANLLHYAALNKPFGKDIIEKFGPQLKAFVNCVDETVQTPLHFALRMESIEAAQALIELGADMALTRFKQNYLEFCVQYSAVTSAKLVNRMEKSLIWEKKNGGSILIYAAEVATLEMCEWLVAQGLDRYERTQDGRISTLKSETLFCLIRL